MAARKRSDITILIPFWLISGIGLLTLAGLDMYYFKRQLVWHILGITSMLAILKFSDKNRLKEWTPTIYVAMLILLTLVIIAGHSSKGAQRWLAIGSFRFQPSEFAKVSFGLLLGLIFEKLTDAGRIPLGFSEVIMVFVAALPMFGLVLIQPDLGTSLIFILMALTVASVAGIRKRVLVAAIVVAIAVSYFGWTHILKEYQKNRIRAFLNPKKYRTSIGYHVIQSRIAIGSGRLTGKGYMKASQAILGFMPEEYTDFIFASLAESFGFVGVLVLVSLYVMLFLKIAELAQKAKGLYEFYSIIALGSIFFWHALINMGMTMGALPVVGVPLPLMSYGGSATLACYLSIGCILSLSR